MKIRRALTLAIVVASVGVLAVATFANLSPKAKAPNFTLPTLEGKSLTLSDHTKGSPRAVVLDIWATWCPPCRAEIPYLVDLYNGYKDKGLVMIGVAIDQEKADVKEFAKQQKISYTLALDPGAETIGSKYKVTGIPATYVIDKKGVVRYVHSGFPTRSKDEQQKEAKQIENEVKTLLAEK
ncbi:MAG: TlpA disulfide reductase family protein [Armatimonadota bacterium]|nr:TlpA family protein disulfide reductase [bacterium]